MEYRPLGRTGLKVSALCLGTMTFGEQNTEAEGHAQMDLALAQGINFFDTAELYAVPPRKETYGRTEEIIGTWLAARKNRDKVILASKVAGPGNPWIRGGKAVLDRANIEAACDASLKRLQSDYIDLYQLHWPNRPIYHFGRHRTLSFSGVDPAREEAGFIEILETLHDLIKAGKIRHAGLSNETAWGTMKYLHLAEKHGLPRMASIQNEYSLLCRMYEPELHEVSLFEDIGLLAWSPLAAGAISGKYLNGANPPQARRARLTTPTHRANPIADAAIAAYIDVARKHGLDVCQMALAFARMQPFTTSVILGATTMEQLATDMGAAELVLNDAVLADIDAVYTRYPRPF